jgi:hypothetical protein
MGQGTERDVNQCTIRGCRTLETRCKDCGRLVCDAKKDQWVMEWISVKDKLPKEHEWIIGGNSKRVEFGVWMGEKIGFTLPDYDYMCLEITHWMPIPTPPEIE